MKRTSILDVKRPAVEAALYAVIAAMSMILVGCGKQSAGIEQSQLKLQAMGGPSARQIACIGPRIEQDQQKPHGENAASGNNARLVAADMAAVADAQMKMQQTLQPHDQNLTNTLPIVDQHQRILRVEVRDVRSSTQAAGGL